MVAQTIRAPTLSARESRWKPDTSDKKDTPPSVSNRWFLGHRNVSKRQLLKTLRPQDFWNVSSSSLSSSSTHSSSSSSSSGSSTKSVRFDPYARVQRTISIRDYTRAEKHDCWFQREDYRDMRDRNQLDVLCHRDLMEDGEDLPEDFEEHVCLRGLEACLGTEPKRRGRARNRCTLWVLGEQYMQQQTDHKTNTLENDGDEEIAEVYAKLSTSCRKRAVQRAVEDREFAQEYCRDLQ